MPRNSVEFLQKDCPLATSQDMETNLNRRRMNSCSNGCKHSNPTPSLIANRRAQQAMNTAMNTSRPRPVAVKKLNSGRMTVYSELTTQ